jgi:hypothetical protein
LRVSCHGVIFVLKVNHFELYDASGQLFVKKRTKRRMNAVEWKGQPNPENEWELRIVGG